MGSAGTKNASFQENEDTPLIYGLHTVTEALRQEGDQVREIFIQRGKTGPGVQGVIDLARGAGIKLRFVERARMPRVAGPHQGVVARRSPVPLLSLPTLLKRIGNRDRPPCLLALDSVQDPRNLGAIIRSALAADIDGIILTRERCAPLTATVMKTSAGAVSHVDICRVVNLADSLNILKKSGYWVYGTVVDLAATSLYEVDFAFPLCLVIGGEGKGIRPRVKKQCDGLITIPMSGRLDSLNCSVAAGIVMFEVARRRGLAQGSGPSGKGM